MLKWRKKSWKLYPYVLDIGVGFRLPILELVCPSLRELKEEEQTQFMSLLREIIMFDNRIDLIEIIVLITITLDLKASKIGEIKVKYKSMKSIQQQVRLIIALFAYYGHNDQVERQAAYNSTLMYIGLIKEEVNMPRLNAIKYSMIHDSLQAIMHASPGLKQKFLSACFHCCLHDGEIILEEFELLRMVAKVLDCPVPPQVALPFGEKAA